MGRLEGRAAIVTGAGRGIGAAVARLFGAEGGRVVVVDRDGEPARDVAADIRSAGGHAIDVQAECADPEAAAHVARQTVEHFGTIDLLVNNAGSVADAPFHTMEWEAWDTVDRDLVRSCVAMIQACLPELRQRAGNELAEHGRVSHHRKIVNTAAASWMTGSPGQANLTAAAGAVVGLTRTLARELGGYGINVNAVAPGFIETRLTASQPAEGGFGVPEPLRQMTKAMTALGRYGSPEDLARVHLFLASDDSDFVTGATVPVTGGMLGTFT